MSRPRGYAEWNPRPETMAVVSQALDVIDEYRDHLPLTVRQIFYRLVGSRGYDKTEKAYKRLGEYLVRARRAGIVPFHAIRDDGTTQLGAGGYGSPTDFWASERAAARAYRRDRMAGQPFRAEVWCEAAGMAPQLSRVAGRYGISTYSTGGFSSVTVTKEIGDRAANADMPTVLFHVGDYDPSGESIFEAMTEDARAFAVADGGADPRPVRVALTAEQVTLHGLPTAPPKATDTRSASWRGETCQAEAMPPDLIAQLLTEAIRQELDLETYEEVVDAERRERDEVVSAVEGFLS